MDLNAVKLFVHAVQGGSFTAGAARARIPLPTLSRRIRELERQLKVQLFDRVARGAHLTEAGARLYEFAAQGVETLAAGEEALRSDQTRLKGRLRVSVPPAFEPWWKLLQSFQQKYPNIELAVYSTERRIDLVEDGIDVALRVGRVADESLVARRILTYRHKLVASPKLLERLGVPSSCDELSRFPLATWAATPSSRAVWRIGDQLNEPRPMLSTNDYVHLRALALNGDALTELPPFLVAPLIADGQLQEVLPDLAMPEQELNLLYPVQRFPSTIVRTYLEFCREVASFFIENVSSEAD